LPRIVDESYAPRGEAVKSSETFLIVSSLGLIGVAAMAPSVPAMLRRAMARRPAASLPTGTLVALAVAQTVLLVLLCAFVGAYARRRSPRGCSTAG
jgi:hypothetical protein